MNQRILQRTAASLRLEYFDADGELADPDDLDLDDVTVAVTNASGGILTVTADVAQAGTGVFTLELDPMYFADLDRLTSVWTFGDSLPITAVHDIVGGVWFTAAQARATERTQLADRSQYSDDLIRSTRAEVEDEAEFICDRAFVPRYTRVVANGTGTGQLVLPVGDIRRIRTVRTYPYQGADSYTELNQTTLGQLSYDTAWSPLRPGDPAVRRGDFGWFDEGWGNIVLEVEYGNDSPPADLRRASITRLRSRLHAEASGIPDRATAFSVANGGTYQLGVAGPYKTGIPDVDGVYARYSRRAIGTDKKAAPASRPMRMSTNSRNSLFRR